jgi:hypothetical protein
MLDRLRTTLSRRPRVLLGIVVVLVLALVAVVYAVWPRQGSALERATSVMPKDTLRLTFTDWAALRAEPGTVDLDSELASSSVVATMSPALDDEFGWGPRTAAWEALAQGRKGQVLIVDLGSADIAKVADNYRKDGFTDPGKRRLDGAVWEGGPDVLATVPGLTEPLLQNVALLKDENLLISSEDPESVARAVKSVHDGGLNWALAAKVGEPLAAVGFVDDYACEALSMAEADPGAQATAARTIDEVGGVSPLTGYLAALGPDRDWTAVFGFETVDQARHDASTRQALARADDPGQMESYPDLFRVTTAERDGRLVVLHGRAQPAAYALSEVTSGPVLLASC